jgi:ATP-dependent Clp protease ATP-binding subunit ClpA
MMNDFTPRAQQVLALASRRPSGSSTPHGNGTPVARADQTWTGCCQPCWEFRRDLTELAKKGELDPVIGRKNGSEYRLQN